MDAVIKRGNVMASFTGTNITLHENVSFPLFSTFPLEIRRQIWKHALIGPHIHIVSSHVATRSRITEIMQTCKEAYDEGIHLQFSHFTFCNYGSWGDENCHAQLPKHYMNPDADIMWLVDSSECKLPTSLALYEGRPTYRMVKIFAINHQLWHDPRPQWDSNVMSWTLGTMAFLPYQMCEEIYVVLNDVAFTLDHGVTFFEPVDGHDELLSSRMFTSQGYEKPNSVLFKEAERRKKNLEDFRKQLSKFEDDYQEGINAHTWFKYPPIIRYVIAKPGGTHSLFTCIKNQKPKVVGHKSLTPLNTVSLPDHLKVLVSNNDDDSWFPVENGTDDYTSVNAEEDVYEDALEYDSHAGDEDIEDDEEDEWDNKEEAEAESKNLDTSTSSNTDSDDRISRTLPFNSVVEVIDFQEYAAFTNNGDGTEHDQMPPPDEDDADL
ncbi:uncharacterized protein EAE98_002462 [Botrytis deweyae]|uniref:2EXR domain-containing protein n=1 Tax=Botrytis deweyae TaxID=2478750 RepID=A0ABQ7IX79_9HELO|nr:uncharacterized protein EAE98_002462 [Botrytis deweyae]KAF7936243.1 hypothetical protein EAE98_002462 [Botrytis deweyae]